MDSQAAQKISISGPALSSVLQRFSSSPGDVDGLLFGYVVRLPPPDLTDDDAPSSSTAAPSPLAVYITGHICFGSPMSFYDPLGRVDCRLLSRAVPTDGRAVVGWFSGRRQSPLRPSMREFSVSVSLAQALQVATLANGVVPSGSASDLPPLVPPPALVFLLLSTSSSSRLAVHTHEYRAFELRAGVALEPRSLSVVNIGPSFREQYGSFSPESSFPWLPCGVQVEEGDDKDVSKPVATSDLPALDLLAEGFGVDRLRGMVGSGPSKYATEMESLYGTMLAKLEGLSRLVEKSSILVHEQEVQNMKLRSRLGGLE